MSEVLVPIDRVRALITPDKLAIVFSLRPPRCGGLAFSVFLELRYFEPHTPANDELAIAVVTWEKMDFAVLVLPAAKRPAVDQVLHELGLRLANGVPTLLVDEQLVTIVASTRSGPGKQFPINLPNVFTLENVEGHFVYKNNPALNMTAYDAEKAAVKREQERFRTRRQAAEKVEGARS